MEVLLPHANPIEIIGLSAAGTIEPVSDPRPIWLHYGSSISHCANAPDPSQTWVQRVADGWDVQQRNLAFGGNAQADQFVARIIRDSPAQLISLSIGINVINGDTMRERVLRPAVHGFLDTIRDGHPDTPIVVVGAIYCPFHERSAGPLVDVDGHYRSAHRDIESDIGALTLRRARTIVRDVTAQRSATDQNLHYVEGLDLLGPQDAALLHDALHPSPEGNDLIAARILKRWPVFPAAGA